MKKHKENQTLQKRAQVTKQSILQAATHVLEKHGLAGFNTNAIAEIAGVSIGSLYQYFKNKDEIVAELLKENIEIRVAHVMKVFNPVTFTRKPRDVVRHLIHTIVNSPGLDPRLEAVLHEHSQILFKQERIKRVDEILAPIMKGYLKLAPGVRKKNLDSALFIIMQATRGVVGISYATGFERFSKNTVTDELTDLTRRYLFED